MTTQTEALKLALVALEVSRNTLNASRNWLQHRHDVTHDLAITAIKEALAQPEQPKARTGNCLLTGVCASEGHKIQKAQPEQRSVNEHLEPVAIDAKMDDVLRKAIVRSGKVITPPQRKIAKQASQPLTDEQINTIWHNSNPTNFEARSFTRAIEAAHGIVGDTYD